MTPTEIPETIEGYLSTTFAKDQPEYLPLPALVERYNEQQPETWHGAIITRWRPTAEELAMLLAGDDLYLEVWTFGSVCRKCGESQGLQPVKLGVWSDKVACITGSAE